MGTITEPETTTATAGEERLVAEKPASLLFMSRRSNLRLVKTPRYPIRGASGQQTGETKGQIVVFTDGRLDVPPEGDMLLEDGTKAPGAEIFSWLEGHPRNGDVNEGFWLVDHLAPTPSTVEMEQLVQAATELDADKLSTLIRQEEEGWNRESILTVARGALERVKNMQATALAAQEPPAPPAADPVEEARAAAREEAASRAAEREETVPPAPTADEPDWEALGAQFGLSAEEAKARLAGPQG